MCCSTPDFGRSLLPTSPLYFGIGTLATRKTPQIGLIWRGASFEIPFELENFVTLWSRFYFDLLIKLGTWNFCRKFDGNLNFSISATQGWKKWLFSEMGSWLAPLETLRRCSEIITGEMTLSNTFTKRRYSTHFSRVHYSCPRITFWRWTGKNIKHWWKLSRFLPCHHC